MKNQTSFVLLFFTIMSFLVPMSGYSADTLTGFVKDSMSGLPLNGAKVAIAYKCSTTTSTTGYFLLALPASTSVVHPSGGFKIVRYGYQDEKVSVMNLNGRTINKDNGFSPGLLLLCIKGPNGKIVNKVLSVSSVRRLGYPIAISRLADNDQALAKSAALTSYPLSVSKDGYNPVSKSVSAGQLTEIKLVPVLKDASGNFQIKTDSLGTLTVITEIKP